MLRFGKKGKKCEKAKMKEKGGTGAHIIGAHFQHSCVGAWDGMGTR